MDALKIQAIPEEQQLMAASVLGQQELQQRLQRLTPKAQQFLRFRILTGTDAAARHLMGHARKDDSARRCACGYHQPAWQDLREATVLNWKRQEDFSFVYRMMSEYPVLYAATRIEQLTGAAVETYADILKPGSTAKDSVRRLAAKDILESGGLKQVEGTHGPNRSAANESVAMIVARDRLVRGLEISDNQRKMLEGAGYQIPERAGVAPYIEGQFVERSLDGDDIASYDDEEDVDPDLLPD